MKTNNPNATRFTIYGNLGADPTERTLPEIKGTRMVYDPVVDDMVEKDVTRPEINFLTYSIGTGGYGNVPLRWINCVDWEGRGFRLRKGDGVELIGYWELRPYIDKKTQEPKQSRQFVVEKVEIRRLKIRDTAA